LAAVSILTSPGILVYGRMDTLAAETLNGDQRVGPEFTRAAIGVFDGRMDVGSPKIAGSATYNAVSQDYTLSAGGVNMWGPRDEFQFTWKRMTGDFILQARVEFLGTGVDPHRKAGWIVRRGPEPDSHTWTGSCTATA